MLGMLAVLSPSGERGEKAYFFTIFRHILMAHVTTNIYTA
jgi:hypothetical protein